MPEPAAQYCRLQSWRAEEPQVTDENGSFYGNTGPLGDMLLIVLSHDRQVNDFRSFFSRADLIKAQRAWMEMQGNYELSHQEVNGLWQKEANTGYKSIALS